MITINPSINIIKLTLQQIKIEMKAIGIKVKYIIKRSETK